RGPCFRLLPAPPAPHAALESCDASDSGGTPPSRLTRRWRTSTPRLPHPAKTAPTPTSRVRLPAGPRTVRSGTVPGGPVLSSSSARQEERCLRLDRVGQAASR